jgi:hypothetical protein
MLLFLTELIPKSMESALVLGVINLGLKGLGLLTMVAGLALSSSGLSLGWKIWLHAFIGEPSDEFSRRGPAGETGIRWGP